MSRIIVSLMQMGAGMAVCCAMKFVICMWLPKPTTLSLMLCLKPEITLTVIIITASPMPTPMVAMVMAGRLTSCRSPPCRYIFRAMNKGRFMF